jgi:hypothetical protein
MLRPAQLLDGANVRSAAPFAQASCPSTAAETPAPERALSGARPTARRPPARRRSE